MKQIQQQLFPIVLDRYAEIGKAEVLVEGDRVSFTARKIAGAASVRRFASRR